MTEEMETTKGTLEIEGAEEKDVSEVPVTVKNFCERNRIVVIIVVTLCLATIVALSFTVAAYYNPDYWKGFDGTGIMAF